jgi:hypothetical protein
MGAPTAICGKCGTGTEADDPRAAGWLLAERVINQKRSFVVRCPRCITRYAREQAGQPAGEHTRRIEEGLERGWEVYLTTQARVVVWRDGRGLHLSECHGEAVAVELHPASVASLLERMRDYEPDFRRWKKRKHAVPEPAPAIAPTSLG